MACTIKNCNCNAVDVSHYVYCNLQATEISKLRHDYSLIHHLHLADSIHSDIIHFIFIATRSFYDEKRLTWHNSAL